ncbi:MAG: hypothetical protein NZ695_01905, partial [Dehalococcoidia bacterium]|nr:hypothetical protein [Dehalococcoidia bacterium]
AKALAESGLVWELGRGVWAVQAMTSFHGSYTVQDIGGRFTCECKGYHYRGYCKHIEAVRLEMGDGEPAFEPEEGGETALVDDPWRRWVRC